MSKDKDARDTSTKAGTNMSTLHPLSRGLLKTPQGPMRSPARVLGWFSIGLGLAELVMPRTMNKVSGSPKLPGLTRIYGLREMSVGVGLLTSKDPAPWLWARVAGDALDVATVGAGLVTAGKPVRTLVSLATLLGIAYIDTKTAQGAVPRPGAIGPSPYDYSLRSGFPKSSAEMRGAAKRPLPSAKAGMPHPTPVPTSPEGTGSMAQQA